MQAAATVHHLHVILVVVTLHSGGLSAGAAPRILRWRYKTGFASGASEKKIVPPSTFLNVGHTSKQISVGAY